MVSLILYSTSPSRAEIVTFFIEIFFRDLVCYDYYIACRLVFTLILGFCLGMEYYNAIAQFLLSLTSVREKNICLKNHLKR